VKRLSKGSTRQWGRQATSPTQAGFRPGRSTIDQVLLLT